MSLIDFIRSMGESQSGFDVELEGFDADSEQEVIDDDISGGRSWSRLLLIALLLVDVVHAVSRLRSSSGDSFTDIALADGLAEDDSAADEKIGADDDTTDDEGATVTVKHDPKAGTDDAAADDGAAETGEVGDASDEETDADDDGAVEVEVESPGDDEE